MDINGKLMDAFRERDEECNRLRSALWRIRKVAYAESQTVSVDSAACVLSHIDDVAKDALRIPA